MTTVRETATETTANQIAARFRAMLRQAGLQVESPGRDSAALALVVTRNDRDRDQLQRVVDLAPVITVMGDLCTPTRTALTLTTR